MVFPTVTTTRKSGMPIKAPSIPSNSILIININIIANGWSFNLLPIILGVIRFPCNCCTITKTIIILTTKLISMVRAIKTAGNTPRNGPIKGIIDVTSEKNAINNAFGIPIIKNPISIRIPVVSATRSWPFI